jgi:hypothetical protein
VSLPRIRDRLSLRFHSFIAYKTKYEQQWSRCETNRAAHGVASIRFALATRPASGRTRPSNIVTANSENVGSQLHSLRQSGGAQPSLLLESAAELPSIGGHFPGDLLTPMRVREPQMRSPRARFPKPHDSADVVRISQVLEIESVSVRRLPGSSKVQPQHRP